MAMISQSPTRIAKALLKIEHIPKMKMIRKAIPRKANAGGYDPNPDVLIPTDRAT